MSGGLPRGFDGCKGDRPRYVDENPLTVAEIIAMLEAGDIGEVEFTEIMLEKGQSLEVVGEVLAAAREEF